jgi:MFS family permease
MGLGLLVSTQVQTVWQLCLSWGLLVAQGFNLAGFAPHLAHVALWFQRRRGVASGLMLSGASIGGLLIVPSAQYLADRYGWRLAYTALGVLIMTCLVPLNALGQRHRPADLGLSPDGRPDPPVVPSIATASGPGTPWTLWRAMGTTRFWLIFILGGCLGWLSNITSVHQIAHMIGNGLPSMLAASVVGIVSLLRAASSAMGGGLSDRLGRETVFTTGAVACSAGLACLALLDQSAPVWLVYGYALALGLGYGVYGSVYAASTADLFFGPSLGTILGALELAWGLGGFGGAWFGGDWYDRWGSYHGAFAITIGINLLGCVALWLAAPRRLTRPLIPPQASPAGSGRG